MKKLQGLLCRMSFTAVLVFVVVLASSALVLAEQVCDTCGGGTGNNPYCCTCKGLQRSHQGVFQRLPQPRQSVLLV